ncbi:PREDICTED: butyrophilin-like protein 1-like [Elephantulus edwardii]|uniref:butyrophilin-like protein 1-like n=1 Tax=Elephantulus edwardii TaxID=28737 RepID=UPI0003F09FF5|nr:PREDICTED: butyrophilin-like protein 1-like [Elephantulus edwardii]
MKELKTSTKLYTFKLVKHALRVIYQHLPYLFDSVCPHPFVWCLATSHFLFSLSTEEFLVKGPSQSIVAELGGNIMLPCSLYPAMNAENMELRWFRSQISDVVFVYRNQQEQKEEQMPQYAGRTSLVKDLLTSGEAAIRIDKVQVSDDGLYTCFFKKGGYYGEATLELKVAGMGSTPAVRIQGPEEDGVRVVCVTSGWFPKPQVQWSALSGEKKFLVFSEVQAQDSEGLFHIETSLVVRDSIVGNVTCSVFNPILEQEKANSIFIPEPFFPQTSPWKIAFVVSMSMLGLLILGTIYFIIREHSAKLKELKECKNFEQSKKEDMQLKDEALKAKAWRKAQLYADWRREQFQAWFVTLDPHSAPANLVISQNNTSLRRKDICETLYYDKCAVLGCEGISSGRCYWEVQVSNGEKSEWAVGVCRENVDRRDWFKENSENRFWAFFILFVTIFTASAANIQNYVPLGVYSEKIAAFKSQMTRVATFFTACSDIVLVATWDCHGTGKGSRWSARLSRTRSLPACYSTEPRRRTLSHRAALLVFLILAKIW